MRRLIVTGIVGFTLMAVSACTHYKPEFNQTYLPNSVPGSPQKRIDIPKQVIDKAAVMQNSGFFSYLPTSLYWVEDDNLVFNIMSDGKKTVLYSFLVIPSTGEFKLLAGAEKAAMLGQIDKNTSFVSTETEEGRALKKFAKAVAIGLQIAGAAVGASSSGSANFSENYKGKIENNGTALDLDISMTSRGRRGFSATNLYSLKYSAKNERTGNACKGKALLAFSEEDRQHNRDIAECEGREWLKSWRVSPNGRYYVIGASATFVDPEENTFTDMILHYDRVYDGFDINPHWDKIVLLNSTEDKKTYEMNYWLEFYPFNTSLEKDLSRDFERGRRSGCCLGCCFAPRFQDTPD